MIRLIAALLLFVSVAVHAQTITPANSAGQTIPVPLPVSSGGTNATAAGGTALDNISGLASVGILKRTGAGAYTSLTDPLPATNGGTGGTSGLTGMQRVLGSLRGANFNSVADQTIAINAAVTAFQITSIIVTNCSTSLTTAAGGFYPTTAKGGTPIVAALQAYTALTGATLLLGVTVAATPLVTRYAISSVFLSLTIAQGAPATCDVYVVGVDLT